MIARGRYEGIATEDGVHVVKHGLESAPFSVMFQQVPSATGRPVVVHIDSTQILVKIWDGEPLALQVGPAAFYWRAEV